MRRGALLQNILHMLFLRIEEMAKLALHVLQGDYWHVSQGYMQYIKSALPGQGPVKICSMILSIQVGKFPPCSDPSNVHSCQNEDLQVSSTMSHHHSLLPLSRILPHTLAALLPLWCSSPQFPHLQVPSARPAFIHLADNKHFLQPKCEKYSGPKKLQTLKIANFIHNRNLSMDKYACKQKKICGKIFCAIQPLICGAGSWVFSFFLHFHLSAMATLPSNSLLSQPMLHAHVKIFWKFWCCTSSTQFDVVPLPHNRAPLTHLITCLCPPTALHYPTVRMLGSVQPVYSSLYIFNSALSFDNSYCVLPVNSSAVLCHPQCCTPRPQDERLAVLRSAGTTTAWPGARAGGGPPENLGPLYSNLGVPLLDILLCGTHICIDLGLGGPSGAFLWWPILGSNTGGGPAATGTFCWSRPA